MSEKNFLKNQPTKSFKQLTDVLIFRSSWGTGAHTGHSTVALWFDDDDTKTHGVADEDDLYIVESIGKEDYWPEWGWIKTPWYKWQAQAINADYHVALMRLAPEYQAKFDEIAART